MGILQNKLSKFSMKTEATVGPGQKRKIKIAVGSRERKKQVVFKAVQDRSITSLKKGKKVFKAQQEDPCTAMTDC